MLKISYNFYIKKKLELLEAIRKCINLLNFKTEILRGRETKRQREKQTERKRD